MKKIVYAFLLAASLYGFGTIPTVSAATARTVSVELTVNSPGAGGSQFVLQGLKTPATPTYTCSKTSAAAGTGTSVNFALIDLNGINRTRITVSGTQVGTLAVTNASYVDQSGNPISGGISVRVR